MKYIKLLFISVTVVLFTAGFEKINNNTQANSILFETNQLFSQSSGDDICSGSCVNAGSWQYCVVYSEMRWGQRNRTAQEAEECNDDCTGTEVCEN